MADDSSQAPADNTACNGDPLPSDVVSHETRPRRHRALKRVLIAIACVLVAVAVGFFAWASVYYHAGTEAMSACSSDESLPVTEDSHEICFGDPDTAKAGLIFYPGAKVEARAYAPLMRRIAEQGYYCAIVKMPFNLAMFDIDAAQDVMDATPQVRSWYVSGHSLGGAMVSTWAADNTNELEGIIFLASYPASDLNSSDLRALSLYGSEDGVLNRENYAKAESEMPPDFTEAVIDGGNHAGFGDYGPQKGDGTATISVDEQWDIAAHDIVAFMES